MSDIAISVENLGKRYRIGRAQHKAQNLREGLRQLAGAPFRYLTTRLREAVSDEILWALKDVSFEVKHGEVLGIIGRNGAGKSTLLKILSRITDPTEGRAVIRGRVNSLLEVGTGFHPELTGRENIYMNAAMHGMRRREIDRKLDEIVAFAEVEKFIDTPVKRYSSGMYVRLAFAVAAHLDPDILILDEVLAVGDVGFQKKCLGQMESVAGKGRTVLFVSHNMQAIRQLCSRALWLKDGSKFRDGPSDEVVSEYCQDVSNFDQAASAQEQIARLAPDPSCRLRDVQILQDGRRTDNIMSGRPVDVRVSYELLSHVHGFHITLEVRDTDGTMVFESLSNGDEEGLPTMAPGAHVSTCEIPADLLAPMQYEFRVGASIANVRAITPSYICMPVHVTATGRVNRAYPGYRTPGKLAPLLTWKMSS